MFFLYQAYMWTISLESTYAHLVPKALQTAKTCNTASHSIPTLLLIWLLEPDSTATATVTNTNTDASATGTTVTTAATATSSSTTNAALVLLLLLLLLLWKSASPTLQSVKIKFFMQE